MGVAKSLGRRRWSLDSLMGTIWASLICCWVQSVKGKPRRSSWTYLCLGGSRKRQCAAHGLSWTPAPAPCLGRFSSSSLWACHHERCRPCLSSWCSPHSDTAIAVSLPVGHVTSANEPLKGSRLEGEWRIRSVQSVRRWFAGPPALTTKPGHV